MSRSTPNAREPSSTARVSEISADGQTLCVVCDHRLDNTRQPNPADFRILANGSPLRLRNAWLQSPMPGRPGCAAIHLVLRDPLPVAAELSVSYTPSARGLRSLVDKAALDAFALGAWLDVRGHLRPAGAVPELPAASSPAPITPTPAAAETAHQVRGPVGAGIDARSHVPDPQTADQPEAQTAPSEEAAIDVSALDREQRLLQQYLDGMLRARKPAPVPPRNSARAATERSAPQRAWSPPERQLWLLEPASELKH